MRDSICKYPLCLWVVCSRIKVTSDGQTSPSGHIREQRRKVPLTDLLWSEIPYVPSTVSHPTPTRYYRGNEIENHLLPKGLLGTTLHPKPHMMGCLKRRLGLVGSRRAAYCKCCLAPNWPTCPRAGSLRRSLGRQKEGRHYSQNELGGMEDSKRPVQAGSSLHFKCTLVIIVQVQK